jgi:nucleoside-diphosphate-sugar epimerase
MQDVNIVFHLAAQSRVLGAVGNLEYSFSTNVQGTLNVLTTARDAGVKRVIFTSSREVYGDPNQLPVPETAVLLPKNVYGASKMAGEAYCQSFRNDGLETVVLRLANVYGTRDHDRVIPLFIENALQGRTLTINGGDQLVDFVWIEIVIDALCAAGFEQAMSTPHNIGSGKGITISELASRVLEQTGAKASLEYSARHHAVVVGFIADVSRARKELNLPVVDDPLHSLGAVIRFTRGTPIKNS